MNIFKLIFCLPILVFSSCIGDDFEDDFVEPKIKITNLPESIGAGETYQLDLDFFNDIGLATAAEYTFETSSENIFTVDTEGLIMAVAEGDAILTVSTVYKDLIYTNTANVSVAQTTVITEPETKGGTITTTSNYVLEGTFTIEATDNGIRLDINDDYKASTSLPGLYVYLTNNPSTNNGAHEVSAVQVFAGAHSYEIAEVSVDDFSHILYYCKPFGVKVGDGAIE